MVQTTEIFVFKLLPLRLIIYFDLIHDNLTGCQIDGAHTCLRFPLHVSRLSMGGTRLGFLHLPLSGWDSTEILCAVCYVLWNVHSINIL